MVQIEEEATRQQVHLKGILVKNHPRQSFLIFSYRELLEDLKIFVKCIFQECNHLYKKMYLLEQESRRVEDLSEEGPWEED